MIQPQLNITFQLIEDLFVALHIATERLIEDEDDESTQIADRLELFRDELEEFKQQALAQKKAQTHG